MKFNLLFEKLLERELLSEEEAYHLMEKLLNGELESEQIAGILIALRVRGESAEEVKGFVRCMRDYSVKVDAPFDTVDTCGTGGDKVSTFNVSTTAAFIACGAGVKVAKHGNRSVSSQCGSADVLEACGVNISLMPDEVKKCVSEIGIGFCFAPLYHQSMKHAAPTRRKLKVRTVFNLLGPLLNPFGSTRQVIGVYHPDLTDFYAQVLTDLGSERLFIVHGMIGMDEFALSGETKITELNNGRTHSYYLDPQKLNMSESSIEDIRGGDVWENKAILEGVLTGEKGAKRDVAVVNAALAIAASGLAPSVKEGIDMALDSIDSGRAFGKLEELRKFSGGFSHVS